MKKIFSILLIAMIGVSVFAAKFKNGQTVYVSKNGTITETEKSSSKTVSDISKGDKGIVIESTSKRVNVKFADLGVSGWIDSSDLSKKKVLKESVTTSVDNIALAGKGKASATVKEEKKEEEKKAETAEVKAETVSEKAEVPAEKAAN
ncbi:MAG: hypothetical protein IJ673_10660 [Treponema sp.]|nr:hypothetical protein [Treponema sp.]